MFVSWRWVPVLVGLLLSITISYYQVLVYSDHLKLQNDDIAGLNTLSLVVPLFFIGVGCLAWLSSRLLRDTVRDLRERTFTLAHTNEALRREIGERKLVQEQLHYEAFPMSSPAYPTGRCSRPGSKRPWTAGRTARRLLS